MEGRALRIFWHCDTPRMWKDKLLKTHQLKDRVAADTHVHGGLHSFCFSFALTKMSQAAPSCQGDLPPALTFSPSSHHRRSPRKSDSRAPHSSHSCCPPPRGPSQCSYTQRRCHRLCKARGQCAGDGGKAAPQRGVAEPGCSREAASCLEQVGLPPPSASCPKLQRNTTSEAATEAVIN